MRSMTGFGLGQAPLSDGRLVLEVRSVNHRFVDLRVRLPPELGEQTAFAEQRIRERAPRGRYDLLVRLEGAASGSVRLDVARARVVYRALAQLRDEVAPGTELPVGVLTTIPALFAASSAVDPAAAREALAAALDQGLSELRTMQEREGAVLERELRSLLDHARQLCTTIAERAPKALETNRQRVTERLERLVNGSGVELDMARLAAELHGVADRGDIAEELARLQSHFEQMEAVMTEEGSLGRRLDFLMQEMAREANTVGAKSQDAELSHLVVELKACIERMREQVQNVE